MPRCIECGKLTKSSIYCSKEHHDKHEPFKLNKYAYTDNIDFGTKADLVYWLQENDISRIGKNREIVIGYDGDRYYAYLQNND